MSYNNNIPQSSDRPANSQSELLDNFAALKTYVDKNHVALSTPTAGNDEGKHKFLQMPEQSSAPSTDANEAGLYAKVGATSAVSELVFRRESSGSEIPFTETNGTTTGWTRLPSGIILAWGQGTVTSPATVTVAAGIMTTLYQVIICNGTGSGNPGVINASGLSGNQFTVSRNTGSPTYRYLAIGV